MSANCEGLNLPMYDPIAPTPLMALLMVLGELAPFRIKFKLGGIPWQLLQVLAM
jgi:hypothetical protein